MSRCGGPLTDKIRKVVFDVAPNLLLVKYSDLHALSNVGTMLPFTHFVVFWLNLAIYALCRILMKCRDLRIFPGTNYRFPGAKNFSTPLPVGANKG